MNAQRKKAEELIFSYLDATDTTGINTDYYKKLFSSMSDAEFKKWAAKPLCVRFHSKNWVVEPTMSDIKKGLDILGVPLMEPIAEPYLYTRADGEPVYSQPAIVVYIHAKKMKQFLIKKTNIVSGIDERDMKTGLLTSHDKGGKTSDREMESLLAMNMDATAEELSTFRADSMNAKSVAYSTIATNGQLRMSDVPVENEDSLSKNMLNFYMIGAGLYTNIINKDYMLPITIKNKQRRVTRET